MTGLTLAGKDQVIDWHNKLWPPSSKSRPTMPAHDSTATHCTLIRDAQNSIQAIIQESARKAASPPCTLSWSALPHPAAFTPPPKPVNAWVRKAQNLVMMVENNARHIAASLSFDGNVIPDHPALRALLETAASGVESAGESLKAVTNQADEVVKHKAKVMALLRDIDGCITFLGLTLPLPPPETAPVFFNAGMLHLNRRG
jgi:hypothetical protein